MKKLRFLAIAIWLLLNLTLGLFLSTSLVILERVNAQSYFYILEVNTVGNGYVVLDPAGGVYFEDTEVELTAVPDLGWSFRGWSGDLH